MCENLEHLLLEGRVHGSNACVEVLLQCSESMQNSVEEASAKAKAAQSMAHHHHHHHHHRRRHPILAMHILSRPQQHPETTKPTPSH